MLHRFRRQLMLCVLLGALAPLASAQTVARIRVMAHPNASTGQTADALLAQLQAIAQVPLVLAATTRTGAFEFALATPLATADADAVLARLRNDRSVLWAESVLAPSERAATRRVRPPMATTPCGRHGTTPPSTSSWTCACREPPASTWCAR